MQKTLLSYYTFSGLSSQKVIAAGQQEHKLFDVENRFQVSGFGCQESEPLHPET
jgi:hypothetical protein